MSLFGIYSAEDISYVKNLEEGRETSEFDIFTKYENPSFVVTPLMYFSIKGDINMVKKLISWKVNLHNRIGMGLTGFDYACIQNNVDLICEFLRNSKLIDRELLSGGLIAACWFGRENVVNILMGFSSTDINYISNYPLKDMTPLMVACKYGQSRIVSILLSHWKDRIDMNYQTPKGINCLHEACKHGNITIVNDIIQAGYLSHINDNSSVGTPLYLSLLCGHYEVSKLLISFGADYYNYVFPGITCMMLSAWRNFDGT